MEVYRNEIEKIRHAVVVNGEIVDSAEVTGPVEYTVTDSKDSIIVTGEATAVTDSTLGFDYYEALVGPPVTNGDDEYMVTWTYEVQGFQVEKSERLYVVVPYADMFNLRRVPELEIYDHVDIRNMERLVARIIDTYCNQSFNFEPGDTKTAFGQGSDYLWLPGRILDLESVQVLDAPLKTVRDPDTDEVELAPGDTLDITQRVVVDDDNRWRLRSRRRIGSSVMNVVQHSNLFRSGGIYAITGDWGYRNVPIEVRRAAEILVQTYFADDSTYRDRYVDNIRAGNWRMEFRMTGDETTGSANADMLLSAYKNINAVII